MTASTIPTAFISYSHDSQDHKKWVLDFATRLRNNGVDAILDQWSLGPGDDLPHFMEQHLASADRVVMVCTENYVAKANLGAGGVGYEKMIVTASLLKTIDSNKVIPVIRQRGTTLVPTFLGSKLYLDFSRPDQFEYSFDELLRSLHKAPLFKKPPVSNSPFRSIEKTPVEKTGDGVLKAMRVVVSAFEQSTSSFIAYDYVVRTSGMSRIMLDLFLAEAAEQHLIRRTQTGSIVLTEQGKAYAIQHALVRA